MAVIKIDGSPPTCHLSISRASLVLADRLVNGAEVWEISPISPSQTSLLPDTLGGITARHATGGVLPSERLGRCNSISRKMKGDRHRVGILWTDHLQNSSGSVQACPPLNRP